MWYYIKHPDKPKNKGENSVASLTVGGSLEAGGANTSGAVMTATDGGKAELAVSGSVTGEANGITLVPEIRGVSSTGTGTYDILVEGTLKGGENSVALAPGTVPGYYDEADITLTVWKAEMNDGRVVGCTEDLKDAKEANQDDPEILAQIEQFEKAMDQVEQNILYIIKYETPDGVTELKLPGTVKSHGWDAATENTKVFLNPTLKNGYKLVGAFNNGNILSTDPDSGEYYLSVPRGGGVYLTIKLEKIQNSEAGGEEAYTGPAVIGTRQLKGGTWLYMFADNTYTIVFPDGKTETGTFEFRDGAPVFTGKAGKVCEPTVNEDGSFGYIYARNDGKEFEFALSRTFMARTIRAAEKV